MKKLNIVFVVLNYNIFDETINCIDSIKKNIDTDKFHVVLVDNISPKNVGIKLEEYYRNDECVTVILNNENIGFAKGNNVGIAYVRKKYDTEFICCINNDTLLEQIDFYTVLKAKYEESQAAVIGPKIILNDDSIQPICTELLSIDEYKKQLDDLLNNNFSRKVKSYLLNYDFIRYCNNLRHKIMDNDKIVGKNTDDYYKDVVLHGSCLIFSKIFFNSLDGFNPKTFMFREEELLYISVIDKGMNTMYCPDLKIRHLEDRSTDSVYQTNSIKSKFLCEQQIKSLSILIEALRDRAIDNITKTV